MHTPSSGNRLRHYWLRRMAQSQLDLTGLVQPPRPPDSLRPDGTTKGRGFFGPLSRPDGSVSSEISIGVNIDGRELDIPTLVPTLTESERTWLLTNDISNPHAIPQT